jgi:predicted membrane protein
MEPYSKNTGNQPAENKDNQKAAAQWTRGRAWAGLVIVVVGTIWIAREAGADIPRWVTSGPMLLVALGIFMGARCNFRNWVWLIPFGAGLVMLADRFWLFDFDVKQFIWPSIIVIIGLVMIFRPRRKKDDQWIDWRKMNIEATDRTGNEEDYIDAVSVFGSTKRNILSKNFRGGEVVNFFGGTELNLMQADITKPVVLDMVQVFGGAKLIVPSNWTIHTSEVVSVFGGVDDKRMIQTTLDPTKILILRGTNVFGGLEIKSY